MFRMVMPYETLIQRFDTHRQRALDAGDLMSAAVYGTAIELTPDLFQGRGFGEAIAVVTSTFHHEQSRVEFEIERMAWKRCVQEVEQLLIDLS